MGLMLGLVWITHRIAINASVLTEYIFRVTKRIEFM